VFSNDGTDLGVSMAEQRTHLPRCEIQNCGLIGIVHKAALSPFDNALLKRSPIPDQMMLSVLPENWILIIRHLDFPKWRLPGAMPGTPCNGMSLGS
jgi:hypothetical protein